MRSRPAVLVVLAALLLPAGAAAGGPRLSFDGGTAAERAQVRLALDASSFDWGLLPQRVTVHIRRGAASEAWTGHVALDAALLDTGAFSWGVVQHEFAHQVDFLVLTEADRAAIQSILGGDTWCFGGPEAGHDDFGCERFATALSWAYWPSSRNVFDPAQCPGEGWLHPAALRSYLQGSLGVRNPFRTLTSR